MFRKPLCLELAVPAFALAILAGCTTVPTTLTPNPATPDAAADPAANPAGDSRPSDPSNPSDPSAAPATLAVDAGPDQTVEDGVLVTLPGAGQDLSGDPVSFQWTQAAGTPVTLNNRGTPTASFTAPGASGELRFTLVVQSIAGQASDEVAVHVNAAPILFIVNNGTPSIVNFRKPAALSGNVAPRTTIAGGNTLLKNPTNAVIDREANLIVNNADSNRISSFSAAVFANGDLIPTRTVSNPAAQLNFPEALAYDAAGDLLFVANFNDFPWSVNVYEGASGIAFTGQVAPARRFTSFLMQNPRAMHFDGNGDLYVANAGSHSITVFEDPAALNGPATPAATITCASLNSLLDIALDAGDRLWALDSNRKRIFRFDNASTLDGEQTPSAEIELAGSATPQGLVIDSDGTAFVTDLSANALYVIERIADRSGAVQPDRTIQGDQTQLNAPWHMLLLTR